MLLLWILCIILAVIALFLSVKIYLLKKSMEEIYTDFENCLSEDTNVQISVSSGDKTVIRFAKAINLQLTKLRKIKKQYSDGDRELKEAVTNISHDLRTPLTAICGYLDLIEKQDLPEDTERYVAQIRNRSEAMKELTEELFRYSIISSMPALSYESLSLNRLLEETLLSFEGELKLKGIAPDITIPSDAVQRTLDSSAVTRIFSNILNNAIKYSDGDLFVRLQQDGTITFSNTAKELSTVEVSKLFDRFYTVDSARKSTGLGLSIAKLLTERMDGTITASYDNDMLIITIHF
ncbi:MAG: HAMP domain-containing histidine kinase [Ruminococcus sp.]|nr:HAMP domain-containing histidine kinase [Ruminococcus sp.]